MKLKALALAGIVSVLGASTGTAQTVFSVNAVGYINVDLAPGFNMIGNQLDAGNSHEVTNLISSPLVGTKIFKYGGTSFTQVEYLEFPPSSGNRFWSGATDMTLNPGEGAFVFNPASTNVTVTFVGEVIQGTGANAPSIALPVGFSQRSSMIPQSGSVSSQLGLPVQVGDRVYTYSPANGYKTHEYLEFPPSSGNIFWSPSEPQVSVGEAFFVFKVNGGNWTRDFQIQ